MSKRMEWTLFLINPGTSAVDIVDLGFTISAGETVDLTNMFSYHELCQSGNLETFLSSGTLQLSQDGVTPMAGTDALDFLRRINLYYLKQNYYNKTEVDNLINNTNADVSALQAELDQTQAGAGLNADGTYTADSNANYISTATSLFNADQLLDAQAKTNADNIAANAANITDLYNTKVSKAGDTMTGNLNMGANEVFTTASAPSDGTAIPNWNFIKTQIDGVAAGYDPKESVRVATEANLDATYAAGPDGSNPGVGATLTANANGALVVDGVTLNVGDRVLVWKQTDATQNGIYTVTATGDASNPWVLTRADDFDGSPGAEVSGGAHTYAEQGTTYTGTEFVLIFDGQATVGTDPLNFTMSGGGAAVADLQAEVDAIEAGAGLNADGTYTADASANYIAAATSLFNADQLLDAQVKANADAIAQNASDILALQNTDINNIRVFDGRVYGRDTVRSKWMGPQETYVFNKYGQVLRGYLYIGEQPSNISGIRIDRDMTLVAASVQLEQAGTCTVHIRKNDTATDLATLTVSGTTGTQDLTLNVDLTAGDYLQVYLDATAAVESPVVKLGVAFNGGAL